MAKKVIPYAARIKEVKDGLYRIINNYSEESVSYEGCDTLVVFTVQGFLSGNKNENLSWWSFLALRREAPASTRSKSAARYDNKYFIPWSEYSLNHVEPDLFEKVVFAYCTRGTSSLENERLWLKEKAEQGYYVITDNPICFRGETGEERYEKNNFYLPVIHLNTDILSINLERFYQYLSFNNTCMRLRFYGNIGLQRSDYIQIRLSALTDCSIDPAAQFYNLIKICEYCIHMQALKALCSADMPDEKKSLKLINPSLGTLVGMQMADDVIHDISLADNARNIDMFLTGRNNSPIRKSRVSYRQICELIVRLRNRYLGHGVMSEQVIFDLLRPLSSIMTAIVKAFVASERLQDTACLPSPIGTDPIPAMRIHKKETYYFCGYYRANDQWYADYLCFKLGYTLRYSLNNLKIPVLLPVNNCLEIDHAPLDAPSFQRITKLTSEDQKVMEKFSEQMQYMPLVYDHIGDDIPDSIFGTNHYSEFAVNICALYGDKRIRMMNTDEIHRMYLKTSHPMYLIQIDQAYLNELGWTAEEFAEKIFLDTIANGFLLPGCKCVMALIGTDPEIVRNPYPWIRNVKISGFKTMQEYEAWSASNSAGWMNQLIQDTTSFVAELMPVKDKALMPIGLEYRYRKQHELYWKLLIDVECESVLTNSYNVYFAGMFKNAFDAPNLEFAFVSLFDFIEFAMRSVIFWAGSKNGIYYFEPADFSNFVSAGLMIAHCGSKYGVPEFKDIECMRIPVTETLRSFQEKCTKYLPIKFEGSEIDFITVCTVLRYLRNKTKGHGYIQPFSASELWELALYYTMALIRFLKLAEVKMYFEDGILYTGYRGNGYVYEVNHFFMLDNNMPCPLMDIADGREYFLNFFTGAKLEREAVLNISRE